MTRVPPADWLDALEAEFASLATAALSLTKPEPLSRHTEPRAGMEGAYLGLISPETTCQIGLASTKAGCEAFARGLLMMGGAEPLTPADVADAVCEIVNMLAGGVQRQLRKRAGIELTLGLPTFFHGPVQPTERLGVAVAEISLGSVPAALLVLHPRR
jgi:hypothetical protein